MSSNLKSLIEKGLINFNEKKFEDAKKIFEKVLHSDSENFNALQAMGVINGQQGNHKIASEYLLKARKLKPNNLNINFNLANSLLELGEYENSLFYYDCAVKIDPNLSDIWFFKSIALTNLKNYDQAISDLKKSIDIDKYNEKSYYNLGALYRRLRLFDKGIEIYEKALQLLTSNQSLEIIYTNLSNLHLDIKGSQFGDDYSTLREYSNKALNINPKNYIALTNLAMSNLFEMRYELAASQLEEVINIKPDFAAAHRNLGSLYNHIGNSSLSEKYLKNAIELEPTDLSKNFLLSEVLLFQNKFQEAWKFYEFRWVDTGDQPPKVKPKFTKPMWNPTFGYKNKLVIWGEQGIGDMILFSSIIPELVKKFDKIYLLIDRRLCQILNESIPGIEAIDFSIPITEDFFDYQIPLCSLGLYFRNQLEDFYVTKPLLKVANKLNLKKNKKYRCGVSWKSKGGLKSDKKNISIEAISEILKIKNIEFYDIQYTNDDSKNIEFKNQHDIEFNKPKDLDTFNDIYGLLKFIDSCDFIISTSNTNAHLAAALGKPTYLLLPKEYGRLWYWDNDDQENQNLWYPTIVKFNQKIQGDWSDPIKNLLIFLKSKYK